MRSTDEPLAFEPRRPERSFRPSNDDNGDGLLDMRSTDEPFAIEPRLLDSSFKPKSEDNGAGLFDSILKPNDVLELKPAN